MIEMSETKSIFLDSNILVYLVDKDIEKREKVLSFIFDEYTISTQVVTENVNVCLRRLKQTKERAFEHGQGLINKFKVVQITPSTIELAFIISNKYQLSWWDSLIIASALENNCKTLYSEDMQDGLVIENTLTIVNPFK
jgi:predicted nucleic acid-binding protein